MNNLLCKLGPLRTPKRVTKPSLESITLGKARDAWLTSLKGSTLPKTWTIERLTSLLGEKTQLHTVIR